MQSRKPVLLVLLTMLSAVALAQNAGTEPPKLNHFDPNIADKKLDPCQDFYKYMCSKWQAENPIPADQTVWSTTSNLQLWNETILRDTLQQASTAKDRDAVHQKVGDYWSSCMDESAAARTALKPVQALLDHIAAMKSKADLPA